GAPTTGHGFAPARDAGCAGSSVVLSRVAAVGEPATVADCADQPSRAYIAYWMEEVSMIYASLLGVTNLARTNEEPGACGTNHKADASTDLEPLTNQSTGLGQKARP
ncbi:hypothetical protein V502_07210, partial [Pseudogymnoascus sp. VKM F-4520 (FW-2644)]